MKKFYFFLLSALLAKSSLAADIKGTVVDDSRSPVSFASVAVLSADSVFLYGTVSGEDGVFSIPSVEGDGMILKVSALGYETTNLPIGRDSVVTVTLHQDNYTLQEVVVQAKVKIFSVKGGDVVMNVAGTSLSEENKMSSVLEKMPGLFTDADGTLVSFKGDSPVVYINGHKVLDPSRVEELVVGNIKNVRLVTNPGARYGAESGSVLEITTVKKNNSLSLQVDNEYVRNHFNSNSHSAHIQYAGKKLVVEGMMGYDDARVLSIENMNLSCNGSSLLENRIKTRSLNASDKTYKYNASVVLMSSDALEFGVQYDGWKRDNHERNRMSDSSFVDASFREIVFSNSDIKDEGHQDHVNAYANFGLSNELDVNIYADWLDSRLSRSQVVDEEAGTTGSLKVLTDSRSDYDIYAAKALLDFYPSKNHDISVGAEFTHTDGKSVLSYSDHDSNSDYSDKEKRLATFAEYRGTYDKLGFSVGLRYEHVSEKQVDVLAPAKQISRNYNDLFPSFSFGYNSVEGVSHTVKYRSGIRRPNFSWLSTNSTYVNRFMRQVGSPSLRPQKSYEISYSLMVHHFFLQAGYTYNKDFLGVYIYRNTDHPDVVLSSWKNYPKEQELSLMAGFRYKLGPLEPSWSVGMRRNIMKTEYLGESVDMNNPFLLLKLDNIIRLPWKIRCNVDWSYISGGDQVFVHAKPMSIVNVGLQRTFFGDRLAISLEGNDIFKGGAAQLAGGIGDVYLDQYIYRDRRSFGVHLTWRLNKIKQSYSGESAAKSEMDRLN